MEKENVKEYIFGLVSTLKMTEKQLKNQDDELYKWKNRAELAKSRGMPELVQEAEQEIERINGKQMQLANEIRELKSEIDDMLRQLPHLAARERSIDPDLLEQELLIALGYNPGEEKKVKNEIFFNKIEKEAAAEDALVELKIKMGRQG